MFGSVALLGCGDDDGEQMSGIERDGGDDGGSGSGGRGGAGRGGRGGTGGSGRDAGGADDECADPSANDCDEHATCTDTDEGYECECNAPAYQGDGETCECADGYTEVSGECLAEDGTACEADEECENGHCVAGICCASACDEPGQCQLAEGATCEDGSTCVYENKPDDTACDDDNVCTENDVCEEGECVGDGSNVDETTSCGEPDACSSTGYHCAGNTRGDCIADDPVDCSSLTDQCHEGVCDPVEGCMAVVVENGTACNDGDACMSGETCTDGVCGGSSPTVCDDTNPCTDDVCTPGVGCTTTFNDAASCSDGDPCTINDRCENGACASDPKDCSAEDDVCNVGVCDPADGSCGKSPRPSTTTCDDGNECTTTDLCDDGTCTGTGNTCGPDCVPNPCDPNAFCNDTTPGTTGDPPQCTCKPGFTGNGMTCTDIDECAGNPCGAGRGTCTQGPPGTYSCSCAAGFMEVNGTCVCNMNGTFAVRIEMPLSWSNIEGVANGSATTYSWQIRKHTYNSAGNLTVETRQCGATTPELCGTLIWQAEAFGQYIPNHAWDRPTMPVLTQQMSLPRPYAGQPFVTQNAAALLGISLTNPLGDWPARNDDVSSATAINGATWMNHDAQDVNNDGMFNMPGDDNIPGVTSLTVPPGGITADGQGFDDPPVNYADYSPACGMNDEWAPWPGVDGLSLVRVDRFYTATRVVSRFDGQFDSCDRIDGAVRGPGPGATPRSDLRIYGCRVSDGTPCSESLVDFYDDTPQTYNVGDTKFVMLRAPNNVTCAQVRAMTFPADP